MGRWPVPAEDKGLGYGVYFHRFSRGNYRSNFGPRLCWIKQLEAHAGACYGIAESFHPRNSREEMLERATPRRASLPNELAREGSL